MFLLDGPVWPVPGGHRYTLEATAYALMALLRMGEVGRASDIVRWLHTQKRVRGAYGSTQAGFKLLKKTKIVFVSEKYTSLLRSILKNPECVNLELVITYLIPHLGRTHTFASCLSPVYHLYMQKKSKNTQICNLLLHLQSTMMVYQAVAEYRRSMKRLHEINLDVNIDVSGRSKPVKWTFNKGNAYISRSDKVII